MAEQFVGCRTICTSEQRVISAKKWEDDGYLFFQLIIKRYFGRFDHMDWKIQMVMPLVIAKLVE